MTRQLPTLSRVVLAASAASLVVLGCRTSDPSGTSSGEIAVQSPPPAAAVPPDPGVERAELARTELASIQADRAANQLVEAGARLTTLVGALAAVPELTQSVALLEQFVASARCAVELMNYPLARDASEAALRAVVEHLGPEHRLAQEARHSLGVALLELGALPAAREQILELIAVYERSTEDNSLDLLRAQSTLAAVLQDEGDLGGARELLERVLAGYERHLPEDHLYRMAAMQNLALVLRSLGELGRSRALGERVLALRIRSQGEEHLHVQACRLNLAITLKQLGDAARARPLLEQAIAAFSRQLEPGHPALSRARGSLAGLLRELGDREAARAEQTSILELQLARLPEHHADVQLARMALAVSLREVGDLDGALELNEQAVAAFDRTLPSNHHYSIAARDSLVATLLQRKESKRALEVLEGLQGEVARAVLADDPGLISLRINWAAALRDEGQIQRALDLARSTYDAARRHLPPEDRDRRAAGHSLTMGLLRNGDRAGVVEIATDVARGSRSALFAALATASPRELEQRALERGIECRYLAALAAGGGRSAPFPALEREAFTYAAGLRSIALQQAALLRTIDHGPAERQAGLAAVQAQSRELARLAAARSSGPELITARTQLDRLQRTWLDALRASNPLAVGDEPTPEALASRLSDDEALVFFLRYARTTPDPERPNVDLEQDHFLAWVVRKGEQFARVELGCADAVRNAIAAWRGALGVAVDGRGRSATALAPTVTNIHALGEALRRLAFDPLLPNLHGVRTVQLFLDDALHLVPFDALPLNGTLLGENWSIRLPASIMGAPVGTPASIEGADLLVACGGVDYDHVAPDQDSVASANAPDLRGAPASLIRPLARSWAPLPATLDEARSIAGLASSTINLPGVVLEADRASSRALATLAPRARYLHLATHGWSVADGRREDVVSTRVEPRLNALSPMLLCGLALSGANLAASVLGSIEGAITAEELATLDLGGCELAILSACDTGRGESFSGQGVASLQKALHLAGARSVITSLWKVPDAATKELMLAFYRGVWVEKKPKWRALAEAKAKLRDAKDEHGNSKYSIRDWAAWVLTGQAE